MTLPHLTLADLAFALVCLAVLLLPFVPALREWLKPTDSKPLPVRNSSSHDPTFFAERLRAHMASLRLVGPEAGYVPIAEVDLLDPEKMRRQRKLPILAVEPVHTLGAIIAPQPLYATADLDLRGGGTLSQVMSEGRLDLGPRTTISGWAHGDRAVQLGEGSVAVERVSSSGVIELARGCCFERVHAPEVRFGRCRTARARPVSAGRTSDLGDLPGVVRRSVDLYRANGDLDLPDHQHFKGSLVVAGTLAIGAGTVIEGDVKAHKGILVGPGARVTGSLICDNGVHILGEAEIGGPVVSETHVLLSAGARVGDPGAPTTVSAGAIIAEEGVVAHGTVWARQAGVVWGSAQ